MGRPSVGRVAQRAAVRSAPAHVTAPRAGRSKRVIRLTQCRNREPVPNSPGPGGEREGRAEPAVWFDVWNPDRVLHAAYADPQAQELSLRDVAAQDTTPDLNRPGPVGVTGTNIQAHLRRHGQLGLRRTARLRQRTPVVYRLH